MTLPAAYPTIILQDTDIRSKEASHDRIHAKTDSFKILAFGSPETDTLLIQPVDGHDLDEKSPHA